MALADTNDVVRPVRISRRSMMKGLAGLALAGTYAIQTGLVSPAAARSTDSLIVNTSGVRLRSGAGTNYGVVATLAKNTEVRYLADGGTASGYRWYKVLVLSTGKQGYVATNFLSAPDGTTAPVIIGTMYTTANVNLRSGPSTSNSVLKVAPANSAVQASDTTQNGFRYVILNGLAGWISDSYLAFRDAPSEGTFTTTARLNLRAQPSTGATVLTVIPSGATVTALSGTASGWRQVSYKGTVGWASTNYLN
jgi:D-alanyl-D-alanine carboxypeptidase